VYNHEALLVQRDLDRLISGTSATLSVPVSISVFLDGRPIAQAGNVTLSEHWTEAFEVLSTLKNGQTLRVLIASDYSTLIARLLVTVTIVVVTLTVLFQMTTIGYQRALRRLVSPLADGIRELDTLSRSLEAPETPVIRHKPDDISQEALALRDAIGRLAQSLATYQRNLRTSQAELVESERRNATNEAVARTTQMLAHDVRRPFSTLKSAILLLRNAKGDIPKLESLIDRLDIALPKMIGKVEGLIADVMEIGSATPPRVEACGLIEIIDDAIDEIFPDGPPKTVTIEKLTTQVELLVERRKILRVFSNILQNAVDAMGSRGGVISIESPKEGDFEGKVLVILRNTNSYIPEELAPKVFDSFFTAKANGTGLGLAIAKKVTEAHDGTITCKSDREKGVSFHLVLPGAPKRI
jgi:signal transduction histidine kinase